MQTHNSCGLCSITLKDIQVVSGQDTLLDNINLQFHCGELDSPHWEKRRRQNYIIKSHFGRTSL